MEASVTPSLPTAPVADHYTESIKKKLLQRGVYPTPKIIHTLRKKELQKSLRKSKKLPSSQFPPLNDYQKQIIADEAHFQAIEAEYKDFSREIAAKTKGDERSGASLVGKPWERLEKTRLIEILSDKSEYPGDKLKPEHLRELSRFLEKDREDFRWLLDDDIEFEEGWLEKEQYKFEPTRRQRSEEETIQFLVDKLSATNLGVKDWRFSRMMRQSRLQFTEHQLLKIVEDLGVKGQWKHAMSVVNWTYSSKDLKLFKSRFVYTKLLSVLGKARRPNEALKIFNLMSEDCHIYPDMAAYHSIAVTLGQSGFLKELLHIIDCMEQKPLKKLKNMHRKNWDPILHPDVVVFNSVLNACIPSCRWKGVSWVFKQLRMKGLKPNGATYGLAMKVMLLSGKYDLVHELFGKMRRSGEALKSQALSYKIVVSALWKENKIVEAIEAVRNMEERGVVGTACVYYELACCLCNNGRWQEAMREIEKMKKLPRSMPLVGVFTGMIKASLYGGHVNDCISIFEMIRVKWPINIGIINIMLKVYGQNDMFSKAKELFEKTKKGEYYSNSYLNGTTTTTSIVLEGYSYILMLKASANAHQWEYFEYVYRDMALVGYHLDQTKHDLMLVEASRAGKPHLLEHTFDKIMENGEIPRQSFFTELICQATTHRDYHRVITLLSAMAYAPWQVSEDKWKHFLEENHDRLYKDVLSELLLALHDQDLPMESTVSNFLTSLSSVCVTTDFSKGHEDAPPVPVLAETVACNILLSDDDDDDDDMMMLGFSGMDSDYETDDETDFDDSVYSEKETNVPSANEILEVWKENRKTDGFPLYR
ncbi:pentatricopeptide repeat-containing protein At5g67570, chloroplastic [Impatiens glandulifera]|uniref:pentatricopeptide repeat-containing protein At5g67570, chloroplastic n=1 Tax=Impatiens glandulifera TaxID=253017 RepID=UPI001FB09129|nr:pentatricopeptide repeat-containing protein At5g67570, chloroplastic [Impatiens glandulifera]